MVLNKINLIQFLPCQLQCKFCLHSREHGIPKERFSIEQFKEVVDMCVEDGFVDIDLTPNLGDFLLDPYYLQKLEYLENKPGVAGYGFVSNALNLEDEFLDFMRDAERFFFEMSVYGFDQEQYKETTGCDLFKKFVDNMARLIKYVIENPSFKSLLRYYIRCEIKDTPFREMMQDSIDKYGFKIELREIVNKNWAGQIEKQTPDHNPVMKGICGHALQDMGIFPDGMVTLCNCWDSYKTINLGNIYKQRLKDIFAEDSIFGRLIKGQMFSKYEGICKDCDDFCMASMAENNPFKWLKRYYNIIERTQK